MSSVLRMIFTPRKMDPNTTDVVHDFSPFFTVLKDGTIKRFIDSPIVPPSENSACVKSKDVVISSDPKVSVRIFLPESASPTEKLPVLVYIHGGGFSVEHASSIIYTSYVSSVVSSCNVIAVSVEYRLAPEDPIPACYDDSWAALKWVVSHKSGSGPDPWINDHADFTRVFIAGDSAGGNITHTVTTWAGVKGLGSDVKISGIILVHPFFGNEKPDRIWDYCCSEKTGVDDPRLNPAAKPDLLAKLGCGKVLVCTASHDFLRQRGWTYYEALKKSEWKGEVEIFETEGEQHVFHLLNPTSDKAQALMKLVGSFLNNDMAQSSL